MKYFFLALLIYTVNCFADNDPAVNDYAKGIELVTEQKAAIYKIALPEEVYQSITKNNLSDIRVFNQRNEPVPHIIRHSKNKSTVAVEALELPYFPLAMGDVAQSSSNLDITVSNEGKVIRIESENKADKSYQEVVKHYLIDASHIKTSIESIDFQLIGNESNYAKKFKLEYSNDLNQWLPLVNLSTLIELDYGNYSLRNTRVDLPNKKIKYMRFTWLDDVGSLMIDSIKANFRNQSLSDKKYWSTASFINKDETEMIYEFETVGIFNIEQLDVELPEDNTLIDVIIESRIDKEADWSRRHSGVFYKLYLQDTEVAGSPVEINPTTDRYWRIKLHSADGIGQAEPILKYAWRANDLFFLARGEGPYILAYGNANITQADRSTSRLMNVIKQDINNEMVAEAYAGRQIMFKGDAALTEKFSLPWERIVLWLVLITGVIVIAIMVYRLSRQMQRDV